MFIVRSIKRNTMVHRVAKLVLAAAVVGSSALAGTTGAVNAAAENHGYVFERRTPESSVYFQFVTDVAVNKEGTVFVADYGTDEVRMFNSSGQELAQWGAGASPGHIAASNDGYLYVVSDDAIVRKLSVDDDFNFQVVNEWNGSGKFDGISGLAVDKVKGQVLVTDTYNNVIWVLDEAEGLEEADRISEWKSYQVEEEPDHNFDSPKGIAVGSEGQVYVAESDSRILVIDESGMLVDKWENGQEGSDVEMESSGDIALDAEGYLYVTDEEGYQLIRFDEGLDEAVVIGSEGHANGKFSDPMGVAVSSNGIVYIADNGNKRIQQFNTELEHVDNWGSLGSDPGEFYIPDHVAIDNEGFVYVADVYNHRIQKFDSQLIFVQAEQRDDSFDPSGVAVDSQGNVYISDYYGLYKFNQNNGEITPIDVSLSEPRDMEIDSNDNVYVADTAGHKVVVLDKSGDMIREFEGVPVDSFYFRPEGIAVDSERELIYASTSGTIQTFTLEGEQVSENWLAEGLDLGYISDIDVDQAGNVYVADPSNNAVYKFNPDGDFLDMISETDEGAFDYIGKVAVDGNGDVYVTDTEAHNLNKFAYTANRLGELESSKGTWNMPFEPGTHTYTVSLRSSESSFTLTPEAFDEDAQIQVDGVNVESGAASASIVIAAGSTKKIFVDVTSDDGVKRVYTLAVSRQASSGNNSGGSEVVATEPEVDNPIDVVVDGQENESAQSLLKEAKVTAGEGGVTVDISEAGAEELLSSQSDANSIVLRFDASTNWIDLGLPQSLIQLALSNPNAVLDLQTGFGTLKLKLADLLRELDGDAATIRIRLTKDSLVLSSDDIASESIGAATVHYELSAISKSGQSKPIVFKRGYVQFVLPVGTDSGNLVGRELAGVALDESGTVSYPLPTLFKGNQAAIFHLKGTAVFTVVRHASTFSDGSAASYAVDAIETLSNKFIVSGMTAEQFQPFGELNRAQYATLILRALGIQTASSASGNTQGFSDVASGQWYGGAIAKASELGIISGYTDGTFKPNQAVKRQELLAIVYNALKLSGLAVDLSDEETTHLLASFTDKDNIAPWAAKAVAFAVKHGIVQGQPNGSFAPTAAANRAQGTVVIYKMLQTAGLLDK